MQHFNPESSAQLRAIMLTSREVLRKATQLVSDAHLSAMTAQGSGPTAAQVQALSLAVAAEQNATAEYLGYLARMSDLAFRRRDQ